jgi:Domain of unknown function (DUF1707)/Cell wall-active antibiotics response 4TMS YvqF
VTTPEVRASDSDRDRVATHLREHLADGRLTLDEFTERIDAAHAARTVGELEELTRDLPARHETASLAPAPASPSRWAVAVMGANRLEGRWRAGEHVAAVAVMGETVVDFSRAQLSGPEVVVNAVAIMGEVKVVVPEGVDVELTGFALMGEKRDRTVDVEPLPGAPRIRVRAFALMGEVSVRSGRRRER